MDIVRACYDSGLDNVLQTFVPETLRGKPIAFSAKRSGCYDHRVTSIIASIVIPCFFPAKRSPYLLIK